MPFRLGAPPPGDPKHIIPLSASQDGAPDDPTIQELSHALTEASADKIVRAVEVIDSLAERGEADALIAPVRPRLRKLQPPRKLNFARVLLYPLDPAIVSPAVWRKTHPTLPRDGLVRMVQRVRRGMGPEADAVVAEVTGHTTENTALISRVGRTLWPTAAKILKQSALAERDLLTEIGDRNNRQLAAVTARLLAEAPALEALVAETANGMLPPRTDVIRNIVGRVMEGNDGALPVLMTMLLTRLPQSLGSLDELLPGRAGQMVRQARDEAAAMLLYRLSEDLEIESRIAAGSLTDAARATQQIVAFLTQLNLRRGERDLRSPTSQMRRRLDTACRARFSQALREDLLAPLQDGTDSLDPAATTSLQSVARALRALETAARSAGSGPIYDKMLAEAAEVIGAPAMRSRLAMPDRMRLVETLAGSQAAVAMLTKG